MDSEREKNTTTELSRVKNFIQESLDKNLISCMISTNIKNTFNSIRVMIY